jgi:hypothetical protein
MLIDLGKYMPGWGWAVKTSRGTIIYIGGNRCYVQKLIERFNRRVADT